MLSAPLRTSVRTRTGNKRKQPVAASSSSALLLLSYKKNIIFVLLCIGGGFILLCLVVAFKHTANAHIAAISERNSQTRNMQTAHALEPPWKHALQPDDILWAPKQEPPSLKCTWTGPFDGFLSGCASDNCRGHTNLESAKKACVKDEQCTGIVKVSRDDDIFQLRSDDKISASPSGEQSYQKSCVIDEEKLNHNNQQKLQHLDGIKAG